MAVSFTAGGSDISLPSISANPISTGALAAGSAAADRISVAVLGGRGNRSSATGVTINGIAATLAAARIHDLSQDMHCEVWYAANPSDSTAVVSVTYSSGANFSLGVALFAMYGATFAHTDSDVTSGSPANSMSLSALTIPTDGGAILCGMNGEAAVAVTWTNATEAFELDQNGNLMGAAFSTTAGTPTITFDGADGEPYVLVGAAWGPAAAAGAGILRQMMQHHS